MSIKEYACIFGVTTDTVRKWEQNGKIKPGRTGGGHRRYTETEVKAMGANPKYRAKVRRRRNIIYCRISHTEPNEELIRQIEGLKMFALGRCIDSEVIIEIGDGKCTERPKFRQLVTDIINKKIATVIVTQKSRLISSGFELLDSIARDCECDIIAVNKKDGEGIT